MEGVSALNIRSLTSRPEQQPGREAVCRVLLQSLDGLYRTAKRLTGRADLAEDLVQETARKALESVPNIKDDRSTKAWLFRILLNGLRDHLRRKKLWVEVADDPQSPFELSELPELGTPSDVRQALSELTPPLRAIEILVDIEEFTIAEAASILQIPPGTVASRLARARREMRDRLRAYAPRSTGKGGRS